MQKNRLGAMIIIGILIIPFAFFGVEAMFQTQPRTLDAATVNGEKISDLDLRRAMDIQKQQIMKMLGEKADERMLDEKNLRGPALDSLIRRELLRQAAVDAGMRVSNKDIDLQLVKDSTFLIDGKFDKTRYVNLLRNAGFSPLTYRNYVASESITGQYRNGIIGSSFVTDAEVEQQLKLDSQTRDFDYAKIPLTRYHDSVKVNEQEIHQYYDQHADEFMAPEMVSVEYIELNKNDFIADIKVTDADIQAQFDKEASEFKSQHERHAAHILIEASKDGSHDKKLADIQQQIKAGKDFAALAKQYSVDKGSAEQGGDVGISTGTQFVPEFEAALAALKVGEVSAPVKTSFGYHIIKLLDESESKMGALDKERARIAEDVRTIRAEEAYVKKAEAIEKLMQQSDGLDAIASAQGVTVVKADWFSRDKAMGILANPRVIKTAFSPEFIDGQSMAGIVQLEAGHGVYMHLVGHREPAVQPLETVSSAIEAKVRNQKARTELQAHVKSLPQPTSGDDFSALVKADGIELHNAAAKTRADAEVSSEVLQQVFSLPHPVGDKGVFSTAILKSGDTVLVYLKKVTNPVLAELPAAKAVAARQRLESAARNDEFNVLESQLREDAKIIMEVPAAEKAKK